VKTIKGVRGVIVPMVTPFQSPAGDIDDEAIVRIVEHLIAGGASIFLLGTTGESSSISRISRRRLVASVIQAVDKRTEVYAGISGNSLSDSLEDAACWAELGVTAVVAHVPCYYPVDGEQMLRYYEVLADALSLPLILYNIPATTHHSLPLEVAGKLSRHPRIIGIKDSERDSNRLEASAHLWRERTDFSYLIGWAAQSAGAILLGADGIVPSTGNIVPGLYRCLFEAAVSGDAEAAGRLQVQTNEISDLYQKNRGLSHSLAALKAVMSELGLCRAHVLPPLLPLGLKETQLLKRAVESLNIAEYVQVTGGLHGVSHSTSDRGR
jgi:dihydrodipicolinate synthase/N-acetylneuraminate lyase